MSTDDGREYVFDADAAEHLRFLGAVVTVVVDGDATDGVVTVTEIDAPPVYESDLHTHPASEVFDVVSGETLLYVAGDSHRLAPGTTGFVPGDTPHGFRTAGDRPLRVRATFVPSGMEAFFREVGTPVDSRIPSGDGPTEAETERMSRASPGYGVERLGPLPPGE